MKITEMLKREFVLEELKGTNKEEVLAELSGVFKKVGLVMDPEEMLKILLARESLGSTGIGDGVAIPHGKMAGLKEMVVSFGRSREGIDFEAMDHSPVHLFFLLMAPENSAGLHLKVLAKISRMLKDPVFRKKLMEAKLHDDLFAVISEKDDEP
ncbi:MAG: PTS sugar transporter subunit IIA [Syntrophales bacterium]|jgi:PTS system nitrogen regulatory IIA component|nr:PTS sugar transporter subunit IIA [Syntrophales bacterium]